MHSKGPNSRTASRLPPTPARPSQRNSRTGPAPIDPDVIARQQARQEVLRARAEREAIREKERAARAAEDARRLEAERLAREEQERREAEEREQLMVLEAEEKARIEAQKKAERDARYAARKANKQKRKEDARRFY